MLEDAIYRWGGHEVSAMAAYSDIFSLGCGLIQRDGEAPGEFKTNPLGYFKNNRNEKGMYRVMFDDTFLETLQELQDADFAIMNGLTYFGRKNLHANASKMYAMIFDLDGVTEDTLGNFFSGAFRSEAYPIPNYVALSGHGVHLYYTFEYAIPLYPNIKLQLKELKYALSKKMWNMYTSKESKVQYQGLNQGFRVLGGKTKIDGVKVRVFRVNEHPFNLENFSRFVPEEFRVDETKLWKENKYTIEETKKKFPDWYQRRIIEKSPKETWKCKRDLYDWWIRKIQEGASVGHRYFCIMCLAIYGVKSGVPYEEVERDAYDLVPFLSNMKEDEPFTQEDVRSALECYDERYITFPLNDIEKITGIIIPRNKRNYQKQTWHLEDIRGKKVNMKRRGQAFKNPEGRPTKESIIKEYIKNNPNKNVAAMARELGVSRTTIYKYKKDEKVIQSTLST